MLAIYIAWILSFGPLMSCDEAPVRSKLMYVPKSTKMLYQLTGDFDKARQKPTLSRTGQRFGVVGTDLGSSFEHKGRLWFLFGDTAGRPGDRDAVAWTTATDPRTIRLAFHRGQDKKWIPPSVPGIRQGAFEVPTGGISIRDRMYVVFTTDYSKTKGMGRSVMAVSEDDGKTFRKLYDLSVTKFINVSIVKKSDWLYIWGSGRYRQSNVHLARVRVEGISKRSSFRFHAGFDAKGQAIWSAEEADAVPVVKHPVVGELCVSYLRPLKQYVMLYNSAKPRGIILRSASNPVGPWSEGTLLFEPWRDKGYGYFLHISGKFQPNADRLSVPQRVMEWGGEYGPYIMNRYTKMMDGKCRIYYTMSTWNPYQVFVMQSDLRVRTPDPQK